MNQEILLQQFMDEPVSIPSILMTNYVKLNLNEEQLMLLLHIRLFAQEGNYFPTPDELQQRMTINSDRCTNQLKELLKKGFIAIQEKQDDDGRLSEAFSLKPLFEKIIVLLTNESLDNQRKEKQLEEGQLFRRFEEEFSRPLTPMELEMISMWLDDDGHAPMIIEAALREAVVSSKLSFRYIDRILFDWKKNGVRTIEQAKAHGEKIRQHQYQPAPSTATEKKPIQQKARHPRYNWLQGEKR
ncbi:DNA replication protein [Evansella vedderi]|uniref:DNA replication protein n=1 Tax=Evansella vedderi TaxID=38282 RepID=A0ABT9ZVI8_9BACI|nr:DnaD domain-containing protein [Evansella vedderi]MDQ0255255.1 DNA replication protein [Evansella vedderi]